MLGAHTEGDDTSVRSVSDQGDLVVILNRVPARSLGDVTSYQSDLRRGRSVVLILVFMAVLLFVLGTALSIGSVQVPFTMVWKVVAHRVFPEGVISVEWTPAIDRIVADTRLPRVLLAAVAGMALTTVGTVVQALLRNPLASPTILGVSSGAATGAIAVMRFGLLIGGTVSLGLAAFGGAFLTLLLVIMVARQRQTMSAGTLILTGTAVSALLSAVNNFMVLTSPDPQLASQVLFWSLGGFGAAKWENLLFPAGVLAIGIILCLAQASNLNTLLAGEESAGSLGLNVNRFRTWMFAVAAAIIGVTVAVCGVVGFIGLVMPHITRLCVGADHRRTLSIGLLLGAIFTVLADLGARMVIRPQELPVGIVTALVGAPFFLFLLRRNAGRRQDD